MKSQSARIIRFRHRALRVTTRERLHVVVIGGGFSGTAVAGQLVRLGDSRFRITLLNADERLGRGLAYSTAGKAHLLNTRARDMSLYPDQPDHFVHWLERHGYPNSAADFIARSRFGDYLEDALVEMSLRATQADIRFTARTGSRVIDVMASGVGFLVTLDDASTLECDAVVLATGHPPPRDVLSPWLPHGHERWVRDPWRDGFEAAGKNDRILMIGSGLTMVDKVLELGGRGHAGPIHVLSRRGLLPRAHRKRPEPLTLDLQERLVWELAQATTPRKMLRAVRRTIVAAECRNLSWHAVIDAMRPIVSDLWSNMPVAARRSFLNRLRPWWEVHRHRMAPASSITIASMIRHGKLEIRAGEVRYAADNGPRLEIGQKLRGEGGERVEHYDWVINCTGNDSGRANCPLDRRLIDRGLLAEDLLGIGYATTGEGEAMTVDGPVHNLYLLGPARRPQKWESTAVPELRLQAGEIATALLAKADMRIPSSRYRPSPASL